MAETRVTIGLIIRDASGTPQTVTAWLVRDGSNTQETVTAAYSRATGNTSELYYNPSGDLTFMVTLDKDFVSGFSSGSGTATTDAVTATPSGGAAPYTYAWAYTAVPDLPTVANDPTAATTAFTITGMDPSTTYVTFWQVTVTDAHGATATAPIQAVFTDTSSPVP